MNIVVLSGSPRKGGNTAIMVEAFKEGAESAGHAVEVVDVAAMKIAPCRACKYCFSHGGDCAIPDDMAEVRERLKRADMLVFASPIYWFDISAQLKLAIDRMYAFGGCGFSFSKVALRRVHLERGRYDGDGRGRKEDPGCEASLPGDDARSSCPRVRVLAVALGARAVLDGELGAAVQAA